LQPLRLRIASGWNWKPLKWPPRMAITSSLPGRSWSRTRRSYAPFSLQRYCRSRPSLYGPIRSISSCEPYRGIRRFSTLKPSVRQRIWWPRQIQRTGLRCCSSFPKMFLFPAIFGDLPSFGSPGPGPTRVIRVVPADLVTGPGDDGGPHAECLQEMAEHVDEIVLVVDVGQPGRTGRGWLPPAPSEESEM
jgi:hypothetical protein